MGMSRVWELPGTAIQRLFLAVAALAFLGPVFVVLTSPDVMTLSEASRAAPEVLGAIAVPVVLLVLTRRLTLTWLGIFLAAVGRSPEGGRGLGTVAATLGPLAIAGGAWMDFAALIALLSGALPELIALAVLGAVACLTWRHLGRIGRRAVRAMRGERTEPQPSAPWSQPSASPAPFSPERPTPSGCCDESSSWTALAHSVILP